MSVLHDWEKYSGRPSQIKGQRKGNYIAPRDRTGEQGPITTKTFIVKDLKHDLLSGKMLNKAGYRMILDEDPEESGSLGSLGAI